jgi:riboflavin synthase
VFTGLVADVGEVASLARDRDGARIGIRSRLARELAEGDSVAVAGACLTAVAIRPAGADGGAAGFEAQAMNETLERTTLGALRAGARVNLELPLRAGDRLGGHVVQGHVDGTGTVASLREDGFARVLEIALEQSLARYLVEKGSVAVDGVSLTVAALGEGTFSVALIPETLARTTLGAVERGERVNLEVDILAKHVERLLSAGRASEAGELR